MLQERGSYTDVIWRLRYEVVIV